MELIRDLYRLWCSLTGRLCIETTAIPADHLNLGMTPQPLGAGEHITIPEDIMNRSALQIDDDRAIGLRLSPTPVIDSDDPRATATLPGPPQQLTEYRVITDLDSQST